MIDLGYLRNKTEVFRDRADAGHALAGMLEEYRNRDAIVLAVPAGGVPVAKILAEELNLPLDIAAVSKITPPWNTEIGYGAVSFNGVARLNDAMLAGMSLSPGKIKEAIARTLQKVQRRMKELRREGPFPDLSGKTVILVDDGIASGFTMMVAADAVRKEGASKIVLAVPTGHKESLHRLEPFSDEFYCANVRSGWRYAVADAYEKWRDISEEEARAMLRTSADARRQPGV